MFLLLDSSRNPVMEITDYLSATLSIRFSSPSLMDMTLSEASSAAVVVKELMYLYHHETKSLFLIDFVERDTVLGDKKAVIIKGNSAEGFLEQRIVFKDKMLDGASLQSSIEALINESIISPEDNTRTVSFFRFATSGDSIVVAQKVKGLVSGVTVMSAISNLLESKNLGYQATYDISSKLFTFMIIPGNNLCSGFTSLTHGAPKVKTVTLSAESETLKDIKSIIDLAPYKTRVYVKNFDDLKIFNRGTTKTGIELREGFISTGHGELPGVPDEPFPPRPKIPDPNPDPDPDPNPDPMPETTLVGLYVLTNKSRVLGCALYPGLPVPDMWYDVTPEPVDGLAVQVTATNSKVAIGSGDFIFASSDRKKIYRASMVGGWFGSRYFTQAEQILNAEDVSLGYPNAANIIGSFGMDPITGQVSGTIVNPTGEFNGGWQWSSSHNGLFFDGTAYELGFAGPSKPIELGYPQTDMYRMVIRNGRITMSGTYGTLSSRTLERASSGTWSNVELKCFINTGFELSWHMRPEYANDVAYFTAVWDQTAPHIHRSKDMFNEDPMEELDHCTLPLGPFRPFDGDFSVDGKSFITRDNYNVPMVIKFGADTMGGTTQTLGPRDTNIHRYANAGTDYTTKKQQWGWLPLVRGVGAPGGWDQSSPAFFVSTNDDLSDPTVMTPFLKDYLIESSGLSGDGMLAEWPIYCWPILGG
jgi:hypothetical protein